MLESWKVKETLGPLSIFVEAWIGVGWAQGAGISNFLKWIKNGLRFSQVLLQEIESVFPTVVCL